MISIRHNITDPYAIYGFNRFLSKYGISAQINADKKPDFEIRYDHFEENNENNLLQIFSDDTIRKEITGYLETHGDIVPLFETPKELNGGEVVATFQDKNRTYPCVTLDNNMLMVGFDIFNEIGHMLSGHLETTFNKQDDRNNRLIKTPVVDVLEKLLFDSLQLFCQKNSINLEYKPFWPNDKKFVVCLTHDVDRVKKTFQYITHPIKHLKKGKFGLVLAQTAFLLRRENPYWDFEKIMEIERRLGVKSTFFFLNEQKNAKLFSPREWKLYLGRYDIRDPDIVEMIKKLDMGGWEIGIHGSYNSYRDLKRLEEEKKVLEELLGKDVHGISQHYLNLDIPETWTYHEKLGLAYDTTIGFVTEIGFRYGTCHPFHPFNQADGRALSLWELPITIMDNMLSHENDVWKEVMDVLNSVEKYGGVLLLRWHQSIFDEREFPGRSSMYEKIIEICKERDAWVTNAFSIVEWLTQRETNK